MDGYVYEKPARNPSKDRIIVSSQELSRPSYEKQEKSFEKIGECVCRQQ